MNILVTGCAGFIGFSLIKELVKDKNNKIIGIDNMNNYYDKKLKNDRLKLIIKKIKFYNIDICNKKKINEVFKSNKIETCFHFAAQAGVRYSIINPDAFFKSNILGSYNILNACRLNRVKNFFFSSSSSVYGNSFKFPQKEEHNTDQQLSFYATTKKSNELMAFTFSQLYSIKTTVLRFFTVYGPFGRPDMAFFNFANSIKNNKPVKLYNNGKNLRDYTYIDDVIISIKKIFKKKCRKEASNFEIINICSSNPIKTNDVIKIFESKMRKKAIVNKIKEVKGDVFKTCGDITQIKKYNNNDFTSITNGIDKYIDWFNDYY